MAWTPPGRDDVVKTALAVLGPEPGTNGTVPSGVFATLKVTEPVGVPTLVRFAATVVESWTGLPSRDVPGVAVSVVTVGALLTKSVKLEEIPAIAQAFGGQLYVAVIVCVPTGSDVPGPLDNVVLAMRPGPSPSKLLLE
jgi:hypothetical protein